MRSLNTKFLTSFLVTGSIVVVMFVYFLWTSIRTHEFDSIRARHIAQLQQIDFSIYSLLLEAEYNVQNLLSNQLVRTADSADFTNFLEADEDTFVYNYGETELSIIHIFDTLRLSHPHINSVYMGREDGSFVRSHPRARPTQYDPRERPWYQLAMNNPGMILRTDPYQSVTTSDVNIGTVTALLDDNGEPYGVVGIDITLRNLTDYVSGIDVGAGGYILLLNDSGVLLTGIGERMLLQDYQEAGLLYLTEVVNGDTGYSSFENDGEAYYIFFYTSPESGWKICAVVPQQQINGGVNLLVNRVILIAVSFLLLLSILIILNVRRFIIKPINQLESELKEIDKTTDLGLRTTVQSDDEVGQLASAFNQMLTSLQSSDDKLRRTQLIQNLIMTMSINLIYLPSQAYDEGIAAALQDIGDFQKVDRVRLVCYSHKVTKITISHEWASSDIEPSVLRIKHIPANSGDWLWTDFSLYSPVIVSRMSELPDEARELKSIWQSDGTRSIIIMPVVISEKEFHTLELETLRSERNWTEDTITMLKLLHPVFHNLLERKAVDEMLARQNHELLQYREHLEDQVGERTSELQEINDKLAREIQAREDMAEILKEREKQYRDLFEHASESIFVMSRDYHVLTANTNAARRLGYSREELLNMTKDDFEIDLSDDQKLIRKSLSGTSVVYEAVHKHKTGKLIPVEVSSNIIMYHGEAAFQWFVRDIRERKQAEKELQQANDEFAVLYDLSQDLLNTLQVKLLLPIVAEKIANTLDADRCSVFMHDLRKNTLNVLASHGYMSSRLVDFSYQPGEEPVGEAFLSGKPIYVPDIFDVPELPRRDDIRTLLAVPLKSPSGIIGVISVTGLKADCFSPNQQRLLETMASQIASAIEHAQLYEAAQESDRLKSAFLATMSHELRTPLNSIIGFTGIILQGLVGPLNEEQDKQLKMVRDSARHLLALINDVLDISKIEAGQLEVELDWFDMATLIDSSVKTVAPMAEKKNLILAHEISPAVNHIKSDRRRVEQILINLINNAVKFTGEGSVRVKCFIESNYVVTRVTDTGIGIAEADMDKLFKPFRQIDTGIARQREGTGLGLSICKKLTDILHGDISVESEPGAGSTFTIRLPISQGDNHKHETENTGG